DVSGQATLAGLVNVALLGGFNPGAGTDFAILHAPGIAGGLSLGAAPALPGRQWSLSVRGQDVVLAVVDTQAPTLSCPGDLVLEATSPAGAVATFAVSATDLVDGPTGATAVPPSGSVFPSGTTVVQVTRTDAHGNAAHATFRVTVGDTTPPSL